MHATDAGDARAGRLVAGMNQSRQAKGAGALKVSAKLNKAAELRAKDMMRRQSFAHGGVLEALAKYQYKWKKFGENIALSSKASWDFTRSWMQSDGHRRNILDKAYTQVGVAVIDGVYRGRRTTFAVTVFGAEKI